MVDSFIERISGEGARWAGSSICREFDYQRGRTDVVAVTSEGHVVAFEAKLERWRVAMHQAYRNRCFADASFVVLPKTVAIAAARFGGEFQRRGVGICYVDEIDGVVVLSEAQRAAPLQPWLHARAVECAVSAGSQCRSS